MSNSKSLLAKVWEKTARHRFILLMSIIAAGLFLTKLQLYFPMARYQHYGIAIFTFGMGYILELIWSWRIFSRWGRISNLATGLFFTSCGLHFYSNNWLDAQMPFGDKEELRGVFVGVYILFACVIACIYMKWLDEDAKLRKQQK